MMTNGPEAGAFLEHLAKSEPHPGRKCRVERGGGDRARPGRRSRRLGKRLVGIVLAWDPRSGTTPATTARSSANAFPGLADAADANYHLWDVYNHNGNGGRPVSAGDGRR